MEDIKATSSVDSEVTDFHNENTELIQGQMQQCKTVIREIAEDLQTFGMKLI